ncbi:hypothetical protein [Rickettsia endosymbiont of Cantharis rufa]|uniref:hypothetical protein n=1 Tax=Rickettsia endosymbiont of Cantharis rufa TaxID=3066248 RepID=UPI0031332A6E
MSSGFMADDFIFSATIGLPNILNISCLLVSRYLGSSSFNIGAKLSIAFLALFTNFITSVFLPVITLFLIQCLLPLVLGWY